MSAPADHIRGVSCHARRGARAHSFRYGVDYVLLDPEGKPPVPTLFGRNRANLFSLWDRDHGGAPGRGQGARWARQVLKEYGAPAPARLELLAQPRLLGYVFNPVSFWLCRNASDALIAVIAEVTNTYGDRHAYFCAHDDFRPIAPTDRLKAAKRMHVSPFQPVAGAYCFRFDIRAEKIGIWIDYSHSGGGVLASLTGTRQRLGNAGLLRAALRRPFGARRVMALIHWQALRLWCKRQRFRSRPAPPAEEVSRG